MTAGEAITRADALMPNQFPASEKLLWLRELDGQLARETGAGLPEASYGEESVLLADAPDEALYLHWLQARMLYFLGEVTRYLNAKAQFNAAYLAFTAAKLRAEKPAARAQLRY